jgi:zinc protease
VYETRIATDVTAVQSSREIAGYFQIAATAAPGRTLSELDDAIRRVVHELAGAGPTAAEMERSIAQAESHFVQRLQTVGGFGGKSDQLNAYNVYLGDPGFFDRDLARYRAVTPAGMQRIARDLLPPDRRVALSVVPLGKASLALPDSQPVVVS